MRFLCDQMLIGLGKWLRAAGYDTLLIDTNAHDRDILKMAMDEQRILLTRDRHFLHMQPAYGKIIFLNENSEEDCIKELNRQLSVNWLYAPFTRCLICNTLFVEADEKQKEQVPADVKLRTTRFWYCPHCQKVYWEGSHTKRMREQLEAWGKV